jgi:hypothetical protein
VSVTLHQRPTHAHARTRTQVPLCAVLWQRARGPKGHSRDGVSNRLLAQARAGARAVPHLWLWLWARVGAASGGGGSSRNPGSSLHVSLRHAAPHEPSCSLVLPRTAGRHAGHAARVPSNVSQQRDLPVPQPREWAHSRRSSRRSRRSRPQRQRHHGGRCQQGRGSNVCGVDAAQAHQGVHVRVRASACKEP